MPFFQYRATDSAGKTTEGTIRSETAESARVALTDAGFRVHSVNLPGTGGSPSGQKAVTPKMKPVTPARSVATPKPKPIEISRPVTVNTITVKTGPIDKVKTARSSDKELFLLFAQMAQYFRSGVTPNQALHELAYKSSAKFRPSLLEAEAKISEGGRISDVMERYPYLYPLDVVGSLRAGEMTGHLDQACTVVADQKESSAKLRRKLAWFTWLFLGTIASIPINYAAINGSLKSMERQDAAGGNLNVKDTLITAMKEEAIKVAPWAVPMLLGIVAFGYIWNTMPLRRVRHAAVLWVPFLGGRAKAEAMARFTWAMALISRGGVSPQQTFQLAADTVPNDVIRERLVSTGSTMHESERLSSALKRANVLPVEFGHIVETGETTGNVPRALEDVNRATDADFRGRDSTAGKATSIMLNLGIAVITLVAAALLYQMFFTKSLNIYMKTD